MKVWQGGLEDQGPEDADLILVFAPREDLEGAVSWAQGHRDATVVGCTGAGQIQGTQVGDGAVVTAVSFDEAAVRGAVADVGDDGGAEAGRQLAQRLPHDGLRHVMILSDGLHVNGTSLADALQQALPDGVAVTGGLAGDGDRFEQTLVLAGDTVGDRIVAAVGFYGPGLRVGYGSLGGWDSFGPIRKVTRAQDNVLYELDGQPALELYKRYLGEHAAGLPATGLLFPLYMPDAGDGLVRTILAVDDDANSLTFAGDVPEGRRAQFMKANFDRLVDGASGAASTSRTGVDGAAELALLVSCVGRRLVLKQRCVDELDAVQEVLGVQASLAGFYSYGEICPAAPGADCQLHNQTMTITTFREA